MLILVAVGIAAVAAVANVLYLNGVQDRANNHARLLSVFVVAQDIPKGTPGETAISQNLIKSSSIPAQFRPAQALTDINLIRGKVAETSLAAGQVVVDGQFVEPKAAQVTFSQRIPAGQVAVTLNFDAIHSVNNLLVPGDKVDMIVPFSPTPPRAGQGVLPSGVESFFYQNVNILAIGSAAAPQAGETNAVTNPGSGTITFSLPPAAAERVLLLTGNGSSGNQIYLALVPPDNQATDIPPMDSSQLFGGGLTPYGTP
jgi:pilus assembly protein CpaB